MLLLMATHSAALTLSAPLTPFTAEYSAQYNGRSLSGRRSLVLVNGGWKLSSEFKTMFVSIREISEGTIDDQRMFAVGRYDYKRNVFGIKKLQSRVFDNENNTVYYDDAKTTGSYQIPADTFDTASQQLFIREMLMRGETEFQMPIASRTRLKYSQFKAAASETLSLPIGTVRAIRVDKINAPESNREVSMWFSPDLDYQLVRLRQTEDDGKQYEMQLKALR